MTTLQSIHPSEIQAVLEQHAQAKNKEFSASLLPGVENIMGVKIPVLRNIAKQIARLDWQTFLNQADQSSFEWIMLEGLVIAYAKVDFDQRLTLIRGFVPKIDNWSVCDTFCNTLTFIRKDYDKGWGFISTYLSSTKEFFQRFGLVMILSHYVTEEYIHKSLAAINSDRWNGYYSEMAAAWALSACLAKFPETTMPYYHNNHLSDTVMNMAIQKAVDSYRVTDEHKDIVRSLRR